MSSSINCIEKISHRFRYMQLLFQNCKLQLKQFLLSMINSSNSLIGSIFTQKLILNLTSVQKFIYFFAFLQLVGETLGNPHLMHLKPIPVILMIVMSSFSLYTDKNISRGLIFGLKGDLCLMLPTTFLFEAGAVFFIIGHICYIRAFTKNYKHSSMCFKLESIIKHLGAGLVFLILIINSFLLWQYLPNKVLFLLYGIVLSSMTASSFHRVQQRNERRYWIGVGGAMAFMISDYLIAYGKFMGYENSMKGTLIMLLYYGGQFMILKGNSQEKLKPLE